MFRLLKKNGGEKGKRAKRARKRDGEKRVANANEKIDRRRRKERNWVK